jgi:hypothetical protein
MTSVTGAMLAGDPLAPVAIENAFCRRNHSVMIIAKIAFPANIANIGAGDVADAALDCFAE